jgi:glycerate dehydrogenase
MTRQIIVADGYTLNPGDLSWDAFRPYGDLKIFDRTPESEMAERCRDAAIIITNKAILSAEILTRLSELRLILVTATGYNIVDSAAARSRGITVCNVPGYGTASVAQHTFALILELTNATGRHARSVANGEWEKAADWSFTLAPVMELYGKKLGIIGMGHIGTQVAGIGKAFGMEVYYHTPHPSDQLPGIPMAPEEVFATCDVISLHCPLTPSNTGMVNRDMLNRMKKSALLINTSRGRLVDENDLARALKSKQIAGAGLDVLSDEPPAGGNPLIGLPNCLITPHMAWSALEARQRILEVTLANLKAWISGNPVNVV